MNISLNFWSLFVVLSISYPKFLFSYLWGANIPSICIDKVLIFFSCKHMMWRVESSRAPHWRRIWVTLSSFSARVSCYKAPSSSRTDLYFQLVLNSLSYFKFRISCSMILSCSPTYIPRGAFMWFLHSLTAFLAGFGESDSNAWILPLRSHFWPLSFDWWLWDPLLRWTRPYFIS